jgi:hypothetical protein
MIVAVGRRAPIDVATFGVFCTFENNFQTAAPNDDGDCVWCGTGARVGLFETSSDVNNCAARVGSMVEGLDSDLVNFLRKRYGKDNITILSGTVFYDAAKIMDKPKSFDDDQSFFKGWRAFRQTFLDWKKNWDDEWFSILSADAYRECAKYDLEAKDWYDRFEKRDIKPTAPKTTTPSSLPGVLPDTPPDGKTPKGPLDDVLSLVKWVVIGGAVIGTIVLVRSLAAAA